MLKPAVFIIEDDVSLCESLCYVFDSINLRAEVFHTASDYLKLYDSKQVGCLLLDIRLPDMCGLALQQQLNARNNTTPIIFITGYGDVSLAVRAMKAGARDFILKPFNNDLLLEQVQKVIQENVAYHQAQQKNTNQLIRLTSRENEIMQLILAGSLNKQISGKLGIAISTVEKHRAKVMKKMQARSVAELVKHYYLAQHK
jgi:two-component system response regulator TtrR